jgi:hypothetical protein
MNSAMDIAVSGMHDASAGFAASAADLVNLESASPVPAASPQQQVAPAPGSVLEPVAVTPPDGGIAATVNMMTAALAYKANIATFKTAQQMEKTLLDAMV